MEPLPVNQDDNVKHILLADGWHVVENFEEYVYGYHFGGGQYTERWFHADELGEDYQLHAPYSSILAVRRTY
jgi:hypothetical protein